jgi:hypothetical protein
VFGDMHAGDLMHAWLPMSENQHSHTLALAMLR